MRWCENMWDDFSRIFNQGLRERRKQGAKSTAFGRQKKDACFILGRMVSLWIVLIPQKRERRNTSTPREVRWLLKYLKLRNNLKHVNDRLTSADCSAGYCDAVLAACLHWKDVPLAMLTHALPWHLKLMTWHLFPWNYTCCSLIQSSNIINIHPWYPTADTSCEGAMHSARWKPVRSQLRRIRVTLRAAAFAMYHSDLLWLSKCIKSKPFWDVFGYLEGSIILIILALACFLHAVCHCPIAN